MAAAATKGGKSDPGPIAPEVDEAEQKAREEKKRERLAKDLQELGRVAPEERFSWVQRRLAESPDEIRDSAAFGFSGFCRDSEKAMAAVNELEAKVQELQKADTNFGPFESRWDQAERASSEQAYVLKKIQDEYNRIKRSYDGTLTLTVTGAAGLLFGVAGYWYTGDATDEVSQIVGIVSLTIGAAGGLALLLGLPQLPSAGHRKKQLIASVAPAQAAHKAASGALRQLMEGEAGTKRRALTNAIDHVGDQFGKLDALLAALTADYATSLDASRKVAEDAIVTYLRDFPAELRIPELERQLAAMNAQPSWFRAAARDASAKMIAEREVVKRLARDAYDYLNQRFTSVVLVDFPAAEREKLMTILIDRAGLPKGRAEDVLATSGSTVREGVPQFESELVKKYLVDAGATAEVRTGPAFWPRPRAAR